MNLSSAQTAIDSFVPTGDEAEDVGRLYDITDALETAGLVADAIPNLLAVFERHPDADLGSPGPIVHCIETTGMDGFVTHLVSSIRMRPTMMTLWMAQRCLRSHPSDAQLADLLNAIGTITDNEFASGELQSEAASTLASHGT